VKASAVIEQMTEQTPALHAEATFENSDDTASQEIIDISSVFFLTRKEYIKQNSTTNGCEQTDPGISRRRSFKNLATSKSFRQSNPL
jgi:hypothetical protein